MCRITAHSTPSGGLTVVLAGNVGEEAIAEIGRLIHDGEQNRAQVVLDLGDVALMDRVAIRFFAGQLRRGVEMVNCPGYLEHWIFRELIHEAE